MWNKLSVWLTNYTLSKSDLSLKQRNEVIKYILDNLEGLPIRDIINTNEEGEITVRGRSLDIDKIVKLRESARVALDNQALKLINEQVLFTAVTGGMHNAITPENLYFYRAAIWFAQQQEKQLNILAQKEEIIN